MKIYFSGSIRGGREHQVFYRQIVEELKKYGEVLTEFVSDANLIYKGSSLPSEEIYKLDVSLLDKCDIVVADVTIPSLGVGYEIAYAESIKKKIVCLYKPDPSRELSAMIKGNPNVKLFEYNNMSEVVAILERELK